MKIVADDAIPGIVDAFRELGDVELLPGREITPERLRDCRCLIVRTLTRVDAALLARTPVEFVASATIGTDHVDLEFLQQAGITFANAPGCNAESAAEYVVSGLFALSERHRFDPFQLRAGIVGLGHVGTRLRHKLELLGIDSLVCDPPLARSNGSAQNFVDLATLLRECDFISLHVPLAHTGEDATFHLFDAERLAGLKPGCLLVNAARGPVVDNAALLDRLRRRDDLKLFIDTWESEPLVSRELLERVDLATPHIAGYSVEGRLRGTQMVLDAACAHFGLEANWRMQGGLPPARELSIESTGSRAAGWQALFRRHCDIWRDHAAFTAGAALDDASLRQHFDRLRRVYPDRREYAYCRVTGQDPQVSDEDLAALGFQLGQ